MSRLNPDTDLLSLGDLVQLELFNHSAQEVDDLLSEAQANGRDIAETVCEHARATLIADLVKFRE